MSRELAYLPAVSRDFAQAYRYYEALSEQVVRRFEAAYAGAEREVEDGVVTHKRVFDHYHRVILKRYPYVLYYRLGGTKAVVVGLLYSRLNPQVIEAALKARSPSQ